MKRGRQQGFTLLEILVVLVIAGLALSVVAPRLSGLIPGVELRSETGKVVALLRYAQSQAMAQGRIVRVSLSQQPIELRVSGTGLPHRWPQSIELDLLAGTPEGIKKGIYFYPDGSANGGILTLSSGSQRRKVTINWLTGRVQSHE